MKRVRYRSFDGEYWGEIEGGKVFELAALLGRRTGKVTPFTDLLLLPPCDPKVVVCVGRNYTDHVREMGGRVAVIGPDLYRPGADLPGCWQHRWRAFGCAPSHFCRFNLADRFELRADRRGRQIEWLAG